MAYNFVRASSQSLQASLTINEPLTIAGWCRPTDVSIGSTIGSVNILGGVSRCQVFIPQLAPDRVRLAHVDLNNVGSPPAVDSPANVTLNQWNHACGVFTSESSRTPYSNGVAGATDTTAIGTTGPFNTAVIGARIFTTLGFYFQGDLAEVGFWDVALTAEEVASLARGMACKHIRPQNLVFYAPLIRNLIDYKGAATITNNNGATVAPHTRVYA